MGETVLAPVHDVNAPRREGQLLQCFETLLTVLYRTPSSGPV